MQQQLINALTACLEQMQQAASMFDDDREWQEAIDEGNAAIDALPQHEAVKFEPLKPEENVLHEARAAFFKVLADHHPEVKSNNESPLEDYDFAEACRKMLSAWLNVNEGFQHLAKTTLYILSCVPYAGEEISENDISVKFDADTEMFDLVLNVGGKENTLPLCFDNWDGHKPSVPAIVAYFEKRRLEITGEGDNSVVGQRPCDQACVAGRCDGCLH